MKSPKDYLHSEALVQAEFYHQCRLAGVPVALEVTTKVGRLDAVVLSECREWALAIVECERYKANPNTRQLGRYGTLGVPVYVLCRISLAKPLLDTIRAECAHKINWRDWRAWCCPGQQSARLVETDDELNVRFS